MSYQGLRDVMSFHPNNNNNNLGANHGQISYVTIPLSYAQDNSTYLHLSEPLPFAAPPFTSSSQDMSQFHRSGGLPHFSQPFHAPSSPFYETPILPSQHFSYSPTRSFDAESNMPVKLESQTSNNVQRSEEIVPPDERFPNVRAFDMLITRYLRGLSPKKRDKALIDAEMAGVIRAVLMNPKAAVIGTAQFRFWVKKMFHLRPDETGLPDRPMRICCKEGEPIAIREKLFKILTQAHRACKHGGRDKTSAQVRSHYSWVPKELIARFVRMCPTCTLRRGTGSRSSPLSGSSPDVFMQQPSPKQEPRAAGTDTDAVKPESSDIGSPLRLPRPSATLDSQVRRMPRFPPDQSVIAQEQMLRSNDHVSDESPQHDSQARLRRRRLHDPRAESFHTSYGMQAPLRLAEYSVNPVHHPGRHHIEYPSYVGKHEDSFY